MLKLESRRGGVDLSYWSRRGVRRDCDTRCLVGIWMNPVIQPAREDHKQSRLGSNPKRLAVWIAGRSHGLHARTRVEELQNTTERLVRAVRSGVHIVHSGPRTARMRVRCRVRPRVARAGPGGNRKRTL